MKQLVAEMKQTLTEILGEKSDGSGSSDNGSRDKDLNYAEIDKTVAIRQKASKRIVHSEARASELITLLAANPGVNKLQAEKTKVEAKPSVFLTDDGCIGSAFICEPLPGMDQDTQERVDSLLNNELPGGSSMQYILFKSPDITSKLASIRGMRAGVRDQDLRKIVSSRVDHLRTGTLKTIEPSTGVIVSNLQLLITLKIPLEGNVPTLKEITKLETFASKFMGNLDAIGILADYMLPKELVRFLQVIFNWGDRASWYNELPSINTDEPIYSQIFDYDKAIDVSTKGLKFGDKYVKVLSAKKLPDAMYFGDAIQFVGDVMGKNNSVKENFLITVNVHYPDPTSEKDKLERNRQWAINQSMGPILKFVPVLAEKRNSFDMVHESINDGHRPCKVSYSMAIFGDSERQVTASAATIESLWGTMRYTMMEDAFVTLPVFINMLPLCNDVTGLDEMWRYKTLTTDRVSPLLPIFGEWKGTGTPHMSLVSRNGQLMDLSMHDSSGSYNFVIAAQSGGGKSFFANNVIESYLSEGGIAWVIDVGRSYEKLCEVLGGNFIHFGESSTICLNPFDLIREYDDEEDAIIGILSAMAAPNEPLNDWQTSILKQVTLSVWERKKNTMTVNDVQEALMEHEDRRAKDIGDQLYPFTTRGSYGKYFNGKNNINLNSNFNVLELEELKGRSHLQQVVLLQLIYQIQNAMYLSDLEDRNIKKMVLIDEAWDLLTKGDVGKFVEHGYRRFRKYGGFMGVITQSLMDLTGHNVGRVIQDNSPTTILLRQNKDTIKKLKAEGVVNYSDAEFRLLSSVHTKKGAYSEMFIKSEYGTGVGRLIVSDFQKLLYTTDPQEVSLIQRTQREQSCGALEAIEFLVNNKQ